MFDELYSILTINHDVSTLSQSVNTKNSQHLSALENEFERYFLELSGDKLDLTQDPFRLSSKLILDKYQDKLLKLKTDSSAYIYLMKNL